jgi:hypothetical protein
MQNKTTDSRLKSLRTLLANGTFHHATYRNRGTLWEGLWVYAKFNGARGFQPVFAFLKDEPELEQAYAIVRHTGVSVGSYGKG